MKHLLILIIAIQWHNVAFGQSGFPWPYSNYATIISTTQPDNINPVPTAIFEGQESTAWSRIFRPHCFQLIEAYVDYKDHNVINIFDKTGAVDPPCAPPGVPPPHIPYKFAEVIKIKGLVAGIYTIRYYSELLRFEDYPISDEILAGEFPFEFELEVFGAVNIDATSRWSLMLLFTSILAFSFYSIKRLRQ